MTKDAYYFSHDSNAQHDEKIIKLRQKHGWEGYGVYWALIERLRETDAFALRSHYDSIAFDMQTHSTLIKSIVESFDLFVVENGFFYSKSLKERMKYKVEKSEKARKSAQVRWDKEKKDANALRPECDRNAIKESKVKKSTVKEKKVKYHDFVLLKKDEYDKLEKEHGESGVKKIIEILNNYKGAKGKTYQSDYLAILNWVVKRYSEEKGKTSSNPFEEDISVTYGFKVCEHCGKNEGFYFTAKGDITSHVMCKSCKKEFKIKMF